MEKIHHLEFPLQVHGVLSQNPLMKGGSIRAGIHCVLLALTTYLHNLNILIMTL